MEQDRVLPPDGAGLHQDRMAGDGAMTHHVVSGVVPAATHSDGTKQTAHVVAYTDDAQPSTAAAMGQRAKHQRFATWGESEMPKLALMKGQERGGILAARERKSLVGQDGLAAGFGHKGSKQRNSSDGMRHQLPAFDAASKQHSKPAVLKRNESIESDDADEPDAVSAVTSAVRSGWSKWRFRILNVLDRPTTNWCLIIMSLLVIFQEDLKYAAFPPGADVVFESCTLCILVAFLVEIALSSAVRPFFFLSFYFWLDLAATLSLGFELPALKAALLNDQKVYTDMTQLSDLRTAGVYALISSKASRAAKMLRLFRMLQLLKLFKEFEMRQRVRKASEHAAPSATPEQLLAMKYEYSQSRVGQRLSDLTVKRVIIGILAMLVVLPAFEVTSGVYGEMTSLATGGLKMLHNMAVLAPGSTTSQEFASALQVFRDALPYEIGTKSSSHLVYLQIANTTYMQYPNISRRYLELQGASTSSLNCSSDASGSSCTEWYSLALFDAKWTLQAQSIFGIARTMFVVILLALGAFYIHWDTRRLVLEPVERMVERVKEMAENPLSVLSLGTKQQPQQPPSAPANSIAGIRSAASSDGTAGPSSDGRGWGGPLSAAGMAPAMVAEESVEGLVPVSSSGVVRLSHAMRRSSIVVMEQVRYRSSVVIEQVKALLTDAQRAKQSLSQRLSWLNPFKDEEDENQGQYETRVLEQSMHKICALLAVGFGDAGAQIVAENMKKDGDLNPMVPGKRTMAIFGFCDIRRFTDTTEVLQEGVMEFVNTIAHIVHTSVSTHGGAANKNIGDAFLLVWKLPKGLRGRDLRALSMPNTVDRALLASNLPGAPEEQQASAGQPEEQLPELPVLPRGGALPPLPVGSLTPRLGSVGELSRPALAGQPPTADRPQRHVGLNIDAEDGPTSSTAVTDTNLAPHQHRAASTIPTAQESWPGLSEPQPPVRAKSSVGFTSSSQTGAMQSGVSPAGFVSRQPSHSLGEAGIGGGGGKKLLQEIKSMRAKGLSHEVKGHVINTIADNALASFVLVQIALARSMRLRRYAQREDINARMPDFKVQMGFGLHVGWAIEGAIGSEYKIDASYLSPNVNLASRLEAATKQFGVPLLMSKDFVDCLSARVQARVRQIDCVTVKGSNQPIGLFTYDLDDEATASPPASPRALIGTAYIDSNDSNVSTSMQCKNMQIDEQEAWGNSKQAQEHEEDAAEVLLAQEYEDDWADNPDVVDTWGLSQHFKDMFDEAFKFYAVGHWQEARARFDSCLYARRARGGQRVEDGPTRVLLDFMAMQNFQAPQDWRGFRELTDK